MITVKEIWEELYQPTKNFAGQFNKNKVLKLVNDPPLEKGRGK